MPTLNMSELMAQATALELELIPAEIGYELWNGRHYKGGFTSLSEVEKELKERTDRARIKRLADEEEARARHEQSMKDYREARRPFSEAHARLRDVGIPAAIVYGKTVLGYCLALPGVASVQVAYGRTTDGDPVNVRESRLSFSGKKVSQAREMDTMISPFLCGDEMYYLVEGE